MTPSWPRVDAAHTDGCTVLDDRTVVGDVPPEIADVYRSAVAEDVTIIWTDRAL